MKLAFLTKIDIDQVFKRTVLPVLVSIKPLWERENKNGLAYNVRRAPKLKEGQVMTFNS